jgi:hypothetical protein
VIPTPTNGGPIPDAELRCSGTIYDGDDSNGPIYMFRGFSLPLFKLNQ